MSHTSSTNHTSQSATSDLIVGHITIDTLNASRSFQCPCFMCPGAGWWIELARTIKASRPARTLANRCSTSSVPDLCCGIGECPRCDKVLICTKGSRDVSSQVHRLSRDSSVKRSLPDWMIMLAQDHDDITCSDARSSPQDEHRRTTIATEEHRRLRT